jgi:hypothetical protein
MGTKITIGNGPARIDKVIELTVGEPIYTYRGDGQKHLQISVGDDGEIRIRSVGSSNGLVVYPWSSNDIKVREMW